LTIVKRHKDNGLLLLQRVSRVNESETAGPDRPRGFQGYFQQRDTIPDAELTSVGPGTPCGEYMRRYWQPVAMSNELADLPLLVRMLGEDLVLFRDGRGEIGLLHRHCAHRGASLEYGIVADRGLICCYHGWQYDIDGTLLKAGSEPLESPICQNVVQGAYPTHEHEGLIFAYLGPPDEKPEFPVFHATGCRYLRTPRTRFTFSICMRVPVASSSVKPPGSTRSSNIAIRRLA